MRSRLRITGLVLVLGVMGLLGADDSAFVRRAVKKNPTRVEAMAIKDQQVGLIYYFESGGKNASAIDKDGGILWQRDLAGQLAEQAVMSRSSLSDAVVDYVSLEDGRLSKMESANKFIVSFSTSHFGTCDKKSGEFVLLGND